VADEMMREAYARDQAVIIDRICNETGLSPSALAKAAGFPNPTITRARTRRTPVKWETIGKLISTYIELMANKGMPPSQDLLQYFRDVYSAPAIVPPPRKA
jgi:hypothetical protein